MLDIVSDSPPVFFDAPVLHARHPEAQWLDASSISLKAYNLIFPLRRHTTQEILLGYKKRGLHAGIWNGFGGKVEPGESAKQAATRELWEESGLRVSSEDLKHVGVIFYASVGRGMNPYIDVYVVEEGSWSGEPQETEEMRPCWFSYSDPSQCGTQAPPLPREQMLPEALVYLPHLLAGECLALRIDFGTKDDTVQETQEQRLNRMTKLLLARLPALQ